jgi:hypothetical protein
VGHEGNQCSVLIAGRDAKDQCWPNLGGEAQVNQPHLAPLRAGQLRLALIEVDEDGVGGLQQFLIARTIVLRQRRTPKQLAYDLFSLAWRKLLEGFENALGTARHE